jgi:hypothetical protein
MKPKMRDYLNFELDTPSVTSHDCVQECHQKKNVLPKVCDRPMDVIIENSRAECDPCMASVSCEEGPRGDTKVILEKGAIGGRGIWSEKQTEPADDWFGGD